MKANTRKPKINYTTSTIYINGKPFTPKTVKTYKNIFLVLTIFLFLLGLISISVGGIVFVVIGLLSLYPYLKYNKIFKGYHNFLYNESNTIQGSNTTNNISTSENIPVVNITKDIDVAFNSVPAVETEDNNDHPSIQLAYEHNSKKTNLSSMFWDDKNKIAWAAKYKYDNVKIFRSDKSFTEIFEYDFVDLSQESKDPHDSHAVSVSFNGNKLGYLFKGTIQNMVNDYLTQGNFVKAQIQYIENENLFLKIYFYKNREEIIEYQEPFTVKLIANGNEEMQENISCCNTGDDVSVEYDFEEDKYLISNGAMDIGYVPASKTDFMRELEQSYYIFTGNIIDITTTASGKHSVKVKIQAE